MSRHAVGLALCIAAGLAACSREQVLEPGFVPPDGNINVDFRTELSQYRLGGSANTTMVNRSPNTITMSLCNDALERAAGSTWVEVPQLALPCALLAILVPPGDSVVRSVSLGPATTLGPGTYRIRRGFAVLHGTTSEYMYRRTNTFAIVR